VTTFGLVHGAWHGAWCWDLLVPELERRGHGAVAPDLPIDDALAGLADYERTVVDALGDRDDVVLVGHSMGTLVIPLVAAARPVRGWCSCAGCRSCPA
jgi:pimeloyl-ACP methyl ester carboxylesterase